MKYIKLQLFCILSLFFIEVNANTWYAEAKCNVSVEPGYSYELREINLWGKGQGKTEQEACANAIKNAVKSPPEGVQANKCWCEDSFSTKRYIGIPHG